MTTTHDDRVMHAGALIDARLLWSRSIAGPGAEYRHAEGAFPERDTWSIISAPVTHGPDGRALAAMAEQSSWDGDVDSEGPGDLALWRVPHWPYSGLAVQIAHALITSPASEFALFVYEGAGAKQMPVPEARYDGDDGEPYDDDDTEVMTPAACLDFFGVAFLGLHNRVGPLLLPYGPAHVLRKLG